MLVYLTLRQYLTLLYLTLTVKLCPEGFLFLVLLVTSLDKINAMKIDSYSQVVCFGFVRMEVIYCLKGVQCLIHKKRKLTPLNYSGSCSGLMVWSLV